MRTTIKLASKKEKPIHLWLGDRIACRKTYKLGAEHSEDKKLVTCRNCWSRILIGTLEQPSKPKRRRRIAFPKRVKTAPVKIIVQNGQILMAERFKSITQFNHPDLSPKQACESPVMHAMPLGSGGIPTAVPQTHRKNRKPEERIG